MIFDETVCELGEGPLWHPLRKQFFWFDIMGKRLHTKGQHWQFDEHVSAAGWVDADTLLVASETTLFKFDLKTGDRIDVCVLEADNQITRSNDGRADPQGGFWIGTMGKQAEEKAGAIWRFYKGELRQIVPDITISNAICFAPDRATAYYCDTVVGKIMQVALDADGWPMDNANVLIDLSGEDFGVDGAVVDANGHIWNAQWGASRVAQYRTDGTLLQTIPFAARQTSCPAFGGDDLTTLFCTSATEGMKTPGPDDGKTFAVATSTKGQMEHQVIL